MSLDEPSMRKLREELIKSPCTNTIKNLSKGLVPPKGVKRLNNIEGSELFDGEESENEAGTSDYVDQNENALFNIHSDEEIAIEIKEEVQMGEANRLAGSTIALAGIQKINKDALFLHKRQDVFDNFETTTKFLPIRNQHFTTYKNARRSVKRRMEREQL